MKSFSSISAPRDESGLPLGVTLEKPTFVPRMVITPQLQMVVREVLLQWQNRGQFTDLVKYGIRPIDRLLFYGPPGNGKTMACYWIARELGVKVYRVVCNQLHGSFLGETTKAVADVMDFFNSRTEPAICLFDEVEGIFVNRRTAAGAAGREIATATTIFLQAIDRWKSPVLIVMATNIPEGIDEALLSRVEMKLEFPAPTEEQSQQMLLYWIEILHSHGGEEWGPKIADQIRESPPESFRELQQLIGFAARNWVAAKCKKNP